MTLQRPADTHHSTVYGNIFLLMEGFITRLKKEIAVLGKLDPTTTAFSRKSYSSLSCIQP